MWKSFSFVLDYALYLYLYLNSTVNDDLLPTLSLICTSRTCGTPVWFSGFWKPLISCFSGRNRRASTHHWYNNYKNLYLKSHPYLDTYFLIIAIVHASGAPTSLMVGGTVSMARQWFLLHEYESSYCHLRPCLLHSLAYPYWYLHGRSLDSLVLVRDGDGDIKVVITGTSRQNFKIVPIPIPLPGISSKTAGTLV